MTEAEASEHQAAEAQPGKPRRTRKSRLVIFLMVLLLAAAAAFAGAVIGRRTAKQKTHTGTIVPGASQLTPLAPTLTRLTAASDVAVKDLQGHPTPAAVAATANGVANAYSIAIGTLSSLPAANEVIPDLQQLEDDWRAVASAANSRQSSNYKHASQAVQGDERKLAAVIKTLG